MPTFRQHVPAFIDRYDPPPQSTFTTLRELIALPVVQRYRESPSGHGQLTGWAISEGHEGHEGHHVRHDALMAIYENGKSWWVVGYVPAGSVPSLPTWVSGAPGIFL